ncbi:MAG: response regulator [Chloroflexi bacterium]|nr:response regulator [Chloroflexota bacterium]
MADLKQKILVVDDDRLIRHVISHFLETDYLVMQASSGLEGLALAQNHTPDLILLDVMLPGMDGYEVCRRLRGLSGTTNTPVIMLTALDQVDAKIRGLNAGADDYLTKPFNLDELKSRVQAHLRRSARDLSASPLTFLPGNPVIEQTLAARLASHTPFAILYIDLNHFKPFNDEYGWLKGDAVIKLLAKVIQNAVASQGSADDFVGHVGGDDFVTITTPARASHIAQQIITLFDSAMPEHYDAETRKRGYIESKDRVGLPTRFPITSVAIAIITNEQRRLEHPAQVAALAAEVKRVVKSHPGSHFAFDRRGR